jgi:polyhydroxyalkanoate synthase
MSSDRRKKHEKLTEHVSADVRLGAPRPFLAHLSAALADLQQGVALAARLDDPRFSWRDGLRDDLQDDLKNAAKKLASACFSSAIERDAPDSAHILRDRFARATAHRALDDLEAMLDGVEAYRAAAPVRRPVDPPVVWRHGSARLMDYGGDGAPLLAVPSLVNGPAILDLTRARSFLRGLKDRESHPFLLDWGKPDGISRNFDVAAYAREIGVPALVQASDQVGSPVALLGHCMGGAIATAIATLAPERVSALVLVATPWDFRPMRKPNGLVGVRATLSAIIDACDGAFGGVPPDLLNTLFFLNDPLQAVRKFPRAARINQRGPAERLFVAVEDWLNDGKLLSSPAAKTLFLDWGLDNALDRGLWRVEDMRGETHQIRLEQFAKPVLVAASRTDTLTPFASARSAFATAAAARLLRPSGGHIGMIVGRRAEKTLWDPLGVWLRNVTMRNVTKGVHLANQKNQAAP